jgi:cytochrome c biogenesis protein CcmG/thiol:disulfide interchange protein DsbE
MIIHRPYASGAVVLLVVGHLVAVVASLFAIAVAVGCARTGSSHPVVGRVMGPLPIVSIAADPLPPPRLVGKVTLLNVWGTWCPPCRRELPVLVRLAARLATEPAFQFIPVSCGSGDLEELTADTRDYLARNDLPVAAWAFPDPVAASVFMSAYGLQAFPTTYLIGPDARIERVWVGYRPRDEADMAAALVEALKRIDLPAPPAAR